MPETTTTMPLLPFLKWAGGKQRLLSQYKSFFPSIASIRRYYEPFIGSGAVFFHLRPSPATLADRNEKLIEVYRVVQQNVDELIAALQPHRNEKAYYYDIRAQNPTNLSPVKRAARFIFLNRTCYNGLYRENQKGEFNVPFGRYKNPTICQEDRLRAASTALQNVDLQVGDFDAVLAEAQSGDFVYLDPPYAPLSPTSSFTSYHRLGFDETDQRRLAAVMADLTARGVHVMQSNSAADLIYELYGNDYRLEEVQARRNINSKAHKRGLVTELLILNYDS